MGVIWSNCTAIPRQKRLPSELETVADISAGAAVPRAGVGIGEAIGASVTTAVSHRVGKRWRIIVSHEKGNATAHPHKGEVIAAPRRILLLYRFD